MSIQGKITSLYTDKTMSEALLPRTNTKAVTDDKGVNLNAILNQVAYVDTENSETAVAPLNADTLAGFPADNYASKTYVSNEIAKAQFSGSGSGDIDLNGFATKDDISVLATKEELNAIDFPVDSVNGKTGNVELIAADVGARPDTWMPSAADVGARPNTWMPSASDVGAAPSGFGLGTGAKYGTSPNEIFNGGFYRWDTDNDQTPFANASMLVLPRAKDTSAAQIAIGHASTTKGLMAIRAVTSTSANEWEWVNPPMTVGTEYRTAQRFNGKVVYCKAVSCGALPSAGNHKIVSIGLGMTRIVGHCGYAVYGSSAGEDYKGTPVSFPIYGTTGIIGYHVVAAEGSIYIECIGDGTEFTSSYITVWYTKD